MSKDNIKNELLEIQKNIKITDRAMPEDKWAEIKNSMEINARYEADDILEKRHQNILRLEGSEINIARDHKTAIRNARERASAMLSLPTSKIRSIDDYTRNFYNTLSLAERESLTSGVDREKAYENANLAIKEANRIGVMNSLYNQSNEIVNTINNSYMANIVDPYEAQILFETTALGYQGVMMQIQDGFSTTLGIISKNLSFNDIENIRRYIIDKGILNIIRMAIIDAFVYGGGCVTPVFNYKGKPLFLGDLQGDIINFFGLDGIELDTMMCFDRYCLIPFVRNNGMYGTHLYMQQMKSNLPIPLGTIFGDDTLDERWLSRFSTETTSNCKLMRPDNFGVSVFARAAKAVYNYEQQIQFLNYALGQLSIVVFNSKSQDYLSGGGNADYGWNSGLGGSQLDSVRSQLSAMQQSANIERGLYLNDVEVTALNRSFQGIENIIGAIKEQAALAFGTRQDILFGIIKSSLGYKEDTKTTPTIIRLRELYRSSIVKILKWCVFGYYAENKWIKSYDNGKIRTWDKESFSVMLNSIDVVYEDNIKTTEDILKESGALSIMKLVEARLIKMSSAISFLSDIPILNKAYETDNHDYKEWLKNIDNLQQVGIEADTIEQEALTRINQAIIDKKDPLAPSLQTQIINLNKNNAEIEKSQNNDEQVTSSDEKEKISKNDTKNDNLLYNNNDASVTPLADLGEIDNNGIVYPRRVDARRTRKEVTQKLRKLKSHEG